MMRVLLLLSALVACALGHAVMTSPTPLNTNPTTARPCGVTTLPANPSSAATWSVGQQTTVGWRLVASDGGKTVSGVIDPTGTGNFNADNTALVTVFTDLSTPSLGNYDRTFAVPNVACAGAPNGLCLFRMTSETNWNSCTYVNITDCPDCPPPPPPTPKCTPANGNMGFCFGTLNQNQIQVYILPGQTPTQIMADLRIVYNANLNNTNVFLNGNDTVCREAYRTFLCALDLPPCPGSDGNNAIGAACKGMCERALEACQVNPLHEALYDCTTLPECPGTSSASTLIASGAVMATAVAAMLF